MIPRHVTDKAPRKMDAATWNALTYPERIAYLQQHEPSFPEIQAALLSGDIKPGETLYVKPLYVPWLQELSNMMSLGLDIRAKNYNPADWKEMP